MAKQGKQTDRRGRAVGLAKRGLHGLNRLGASAGKRVRKGTRRSENTSAR